MIPGDRKLIGFCKCCSTKLEQIHLNTNTDRQIHTKKTKNKTEIVMRRRWSSVTAVVCEVGTDRAGQVMLYSLTQRL